LIKPCAGRDFDGRTSSTSPSTRNASPGRTAGREDRSGGADHRNHATLDLRDLVWQAKFARDGDNTCSEGPCPIERHGGRSGWGCG
jgi:hypothetical protein